MSPFFIALISFAALALLILVIAVIVGILTAARSFDRGEWDTAVPRPSRTEKGEMGERYVNDFLRSIATKDDLLLSDTILVDPKSGRSAQIDHIFITHAGVFVIETKNFAGLIFGKQEDREWTEVLAGGTVCNRFYSPFKQNATHTCLVSRLLGRHTPVSGAVVFTGGDISHVNCENVFDMRAFSIYMRGQTEILLNSEEMIACCRKLRDNRDAYNVTKEEHFASIRRSEELLARGLCPRCGRQLVLRSGKFGQFYGCSGYPACKFKKKP